MISSRYFAGLVPAGWAVVAVDGVTFADKAASAAIDGNPATHWIGATVQGDPSPCRITIDMGSLRRIHGFAYLPRRDGSADGVVENYRFESSADGVNWTTNIESGRFGNIRNNPVQQEATFTPVEARFFRFTMLKELGDNGRMSIAEISVLPVVDATGK